MSVNAGVGAAAQETSPRGGGRWLSFAGGGLLAPAKAGGFARLACASMGMRRAVSSGAHHGERLGPAAQHEGDLQAGLVGEPETFHGVGMSADDPHR